jgi:hypothetical protein
MRRAHFVPVFVLALVACRPPSPPTPPVPPTPAPTVAPDAPGAASAASPALTADGHAFAAATSYLGSCAPAGSRGGCYRFRFAPDGTATHVLMDAPLHGRYRIEGDMVLFTSTAPGASEERLPLTDGRRVLAGDYRLEP